MCQKSSYTFLLHGYSIKIKWFSKKSPFLSRVYISITSGPHKSTMSTLLIVFQCLYFRSCNQFVNVIFVLNLWLNFTNSELFSIIWICGSRQRNTAWIKGKFIWIIQSSKGYCSLITKLSCSCKLGNLMGKKVRIYPLSYMVSWE